MPHSTRVWRASPSGGPYAENVLSAHPSANEGYGLDLSALLPTATTVGSAAVSVSPHWPHLGSRHNTDSSFNTYLANSTGSPTDTFTSPDSDDKITFLGYR